ncbi:MAG: hypothetical protein QM664_12195 [Flavihumibacter sp.]
MNEFSYKRLGLRVQLDAVQGVEYGMPTGVPARAWVTVKWPSRSNGTVAPRLFNGVYAIEEWRIDDRSFVKLREISLSYNTGPIGEAFKGLTISASGRNLISWDNYKGYDPEVNSGGQSTILRGVDFGSVPIPASFSIGVSAKF